MISSDVATPSSILIRVGSSSGARELFTRFDTGQRCSVGGFHKCRCTLRVTMLPLFEIFFFEDNRHPVVNFRHELIPPSDDHRAGFYLFTRGAVVPFVS